MSIIEKATPEELNEYDLAYQKIEDEIGWIATKSKNPDISPAEVVKLDTKWKKLSACMIGPLDMAKEFDDFSCKDYWESPGVDPYYCKEGYGALSLIMDVNCRFSWLRLHIISTGRDRV